MLNDRNGIIAIIFDLDDTLYDCTGTLVQRGRRKAARTIARAINCTEEYALRLQADIGERHESTRNIYKEIVSIYNLPLTYINKFLDEFIHVEISGISLFPDVVDTLAYLKERKYRLFLVTSGEEQVQAKKIDVLGLRNDYFDKIYIVERDYGQLKKHCFEQILVQYCLRPEEVVCIGDKINDELSAGMSLNMVTVMLKHGRHYTAYLKRQNTYTIPDYFIKQIRDLLV